MTKLLKYQLVLLCSLAIFGCEKNDDLSPEQAIIGTWQLAESFIDIGDGSGDWMSVDDGYEYKFTSNNEFTSNRFSECTSGTYSINMNQITLDFGCEGFSTGIESPDGTFIEQYSFDSNDLILRPTYVTCVEECGLKFRKRK